MFNSQFGTALETKMNHLQTVITHIIKTFVKVVSCMNCIWNTNDKSTKVYCTFTKFNDAEFKKVFTLHLQRILYQCKGVRYDFVNHSNFQISRIHYLGDHSTVILQRV